MNIDTRVRKATRVLSDAIEREKRADGRFVPPGLSMQKIVAGVTGINIALGNVAFQAQDFVCREKFPQSFQSKADPDFLRSNCLKNKQYIEDMLPRLESKLTEFSVTGEHFRESNYQFLKISWRTMGETLKSLNDICGGLPDDRLARGMNAVIFLGVATMKSMEDFVIHTCGKPIH